MRKAFYKEKLGIATPEHVTPYIRGRAVEGQQESKEVEQHIRIDKELILLEEDEIHIDGKSLVPKDIVKMMLESLLKSNPERFKDYSVIEFGDVFTVGKILHPSQMEMLTCEICGFFTPYSAELYTHRMTHFGI